MMERKWTKGPWRVWGKPSEADMVCGGHVNICEPEKEFRHSHFASISVGNAWPEGIANAHLIAAAPDMYEAIDAALTEYTLHGSLTDSARLLRAALARARGEA
jgi:hypothetical protein